jgi:hypothetical protein
MGLCAGILDRTHLLRHELLAERRLAQIAVDQETCHNDSAPQGPELAWLPIPGAPKILMTRALGERPDGATHLEFRVDKPKPKDKAFLDQVAPKFAEDLSAR